LFSNAYLVLLYIKINKVLSIFYSQMFVCVCFVRLCPFVSMNKVHKPFVNNYKTLTNEHGQSFMFGTCSRTVREQLKTLTKEHGQTSSVSIRFVYSPSGSLSSLLPFTSIYVWLSFSYFSPKIFFSQIRTFLTITKFYLLKNIYCPQNSIYLFYGENMLC